MKHYLVYFAAVYSFALLLGILFSLLNLNTSISIPTLIAAGFITAGHFVKREQRRPSDDERIQLIWSCTITSLIITSLVLFFYSLLSPAASNILNVVKSTNIILIAIMMLLILVHAVVFFVSFGWYANRCAQKLNV